MNALFAGIDGGQSSTQAIVGDERGRVLGRGAAGPCDEIGENATSTKLADALRSALRDATKNAGLSEETRFTMIVAAISGYEGRVYGVAPQLPTEHLKIVHDAPAAHAAAFGEEPGVVAIAGTGSVVYARDKRGAEATFGGWGYLFGDEGSAFWIAREALAALMRAEDAGDAAFDEERRTALAFFGLNSLRSIARALYGGTISRDRIAAFAPVAMQSRAFAAIVRSAATQLGRLACSALDIMHLDRVSLCGGLFRSRRYYETFARVIVDCHPGARVVPPKYEPVAGALLLAYRDASLPVRELQP